MALTRIQPSALDKTLNYTANTFTANYITFGDGTSQTSAKPRVSPLSGTITSPYQANSDSFDIIVITGLSNNLTFNAPSGSPTNGQKLIYRISDDGTVRTLNFTAFTAVGVTLPTATIGTSTKVIYVGCIYNADNTPRWDVIAVGTQA
jgi:hypothetical protein